MIFTGVRFNALVLLSCGILFANPGVAQELDSNARKAIATFGEGVITPVPGKVTVKGAIEYLGLMPGKTNYQIVSGDSKGTMIERNVQPKAGESGTFTVTRGKEQTLTITSGKKGAFASQEVSASTSSLSTFDPSEPILIEGASTGSPVKSTIKVAVHDVSKPDVVTHSGSLKSTFEVLGGFKVKTTTGSYDTIGVRVKYEGTVGPASVSDESYAFFAKGVGPVAMLNRSQVSAFLIYNKQVKQSMVLVVPPGGKK